MYWTTLTIYFLASSRLNYAAKQSMLRRLSSVSRFTQGVSYFTEDSKHVISTNADRARFVYAIDVDGDGDVDVLSASLLDDKIAWHENEFRCLVGYYFNNNDCLPCSAGKSSYPSTTSICTDCSAGMYSAAGDACTVCDEGKSSLAGASECSRYCIIECVSGYVESIGTCIPCSSKQACDGCSCNDGYIGELCQICAPGFFADNNECTQCPNVHIAIIVASLLVILIILGILLYYLTKRLINYSGFASIMIAHSQILQIIIMHIKLNTSHSLLGFVRRVNSILSLFFLDLAFDEVYRPECIVTFEFYEWWMLSTFTPISLSIFFSVFAWLDVDHGLGIAYMSMCVMYVYVMSRAWILWDCVQTESGYVLDSDGTKSCMSDGTKQWQAYSKIALVIAFFTSLIPAIMYAKLWFVSSQKRADDYTTIHSMGFLYLKYKEDCYWWDPVVEMPKRWFILFWATFMPTAVTQAIMQIVFLCAFCIAHYKYMPYKDDWCDDNGDVIDDYFSQNIENHLQFYMYALEILLVVSLVIAEKIGSYTNVLIIIFCTLYFVAILVLVINVLYIFRRQRKRDRVVTSEVQNYRKFRKIVPHPNY